MYDLGDKVKIVTWDEEFDGSEGVINFVDSIDDTYGVTITASPTERMVGKSYSFLSSEVVL